MSTHPKNGRQPPRNVRKTGRGHYSGTACARPEGTAPQSAAIAYQLGSMLVEATSELRQTVQEAQRCLQLAVSLGDQVGALVRALEALAAVSCRGQERGSSTDLGALNQGVAALSELSAISDELCRALNAQQEALRQMLAGKQAVCQETTAGAQAAAETNSPPMVLEERIKLAEQLIKGGLPEQDVARQCGLAREEVRLLVRRCQAGTNNRGLSDRCA